MLSLLCLAIKLSINSFNKSIFMVYVLTLYIDSTHIHSIELLLFTILSRISKTILPPFSILFIHWNTWQVKNLHLYIDLCVHFFKAVIVFIQFSCFLVTVYYLFYLWNCFFDKSKAMWNNANLRCGSFRNRNIQSLCRHVTRW